MHKFQYWNNLDKNLTENWEAAIIVHELIPFLVSPCWKKHNMNF